MTKKNTDPDGRKFELIQGGDQPDDSSDADELAPLRELLVAAGAPAEVLAVLDGPGSPDEIVQRLTDDGVLPSPADSIAGIVDQWEPLLRSRLDPLEAELAGYEFLDLFRQSASDADELPEMLQTLVGQVEQHGGRAALAMLRTLGVVGPDGVRDAAAAAADRLVTTGIADLTWARTLGAPKLGTCFGYIDQFGAQESIAITFSYGRRHHALAVLIDHDLGGGVKDCWLSDQVEQLRSDYQRAATWHGLQPREYDRARAAGILQKALSAQPCPEQPDQVEDVSAYLELVRRRVELLSSNLTSGGRGPAAGAVQTGRDRDVHRVKIGLRGAKPPIWRRLEVPSHIKLDKLHRRIQEAFGWEDAHLWVFETPHGQYGRTDTELGHRSAASKRLADVAPAKGDRLRYTYDFGDGWEHDIVVEEVAAAEPGVRYPRCLTGRRAAPPEDCGGIWGYVVMQEILADPEHPDHEQLLQWLGLESADEFDPAAFDHDEVNRALTTRVLVRR